jgi:hypothetical protein
MSDNFDGHAIVLLIEALHYYKPESRGFDFQLCQWIFNLPNPYIRTMAPKSIQPVTEMSTTNLPGVKHDQTARKTDNLTAICESIV